MHILVQLRPIRGAVYTIYYLEYYYSSGGVTSQQFSCYYKLTGGSSSESVTTLPSFTGYAPEGTTAVTASNGGTVLVSSDSLSDGGGTKILYFINYARLYVNARDDQAYAAFGFLILYIVLIVFTIMFLIRYLKRLIYIAFLTLIAPLVALTYPLDKIRDRTSTSV